MWSVCWDSGEGQLGLTRGGPVSPNCHREHGQRGSVSTVINHTPSLSLFLFLYHFSSLPLSLSHCFLFALSLTLLHSLYFPVLLSAFVFPLTFSLSSLRYPLCHLENQLFRFQSHSVRAFNSPPPSHIHTLTFLVWLIFFFCCSLICFTPTMLQS